MIGTHWFVYSYISFLYRLQWGAQRSTCRLEVLSSLPQRFMFRLSVMNLIFKEKETNRGSRSSVYTSTGLLSVQRGKNLGSPNSKLLMLTWIKHQYVFDSGLCQDLPDLRISWTLQTMMYSYCILMEHRFSVTWVFGMKQHTTRVTLDITGEGNEFSWLSKNASLKKWRHIWTFLVGRTEEVRFHRPGSHKSGANSKQRNKQVNFWLWPNWT